MRVSAVLLIVLSIGCGSPSPPVAVTATTLPQETSPVSSTFSTTTSLRPPSTTSTTILSPPEPTPFTDADLLAHLLVRAETVIRDPQTVEPGLVGWAWVQQQAYRDLVTHPEWDDHVQAATPESLHDALDANLRAGQHLRTLTEPQPELPDWDIVRPPAADELLSHYRAAEEAFGVPWEHLAAIHLVETRMGRIRGASPAGAQGPMQFLPSTWEAYGEGDINDPRDSIFAAARYLVAHGAPLDLPAALFAYNRSDHYVAAITAYAGVMRENARAYLGYYHWRVFYRLETGDVVLDEGWSG